MATPSEFEFKRWLKWLRARGFKPVPTHVGTKAAASKDYAADGYEPPPDEMWTIEPGKFNLGVKTGEDSNCLVDIDLDCPEAIFFAKHFLPPTRAVFGRASKPASHYLYCVTGGDLSTFKLLDPVRNNQSGQTILEFRGSGGNQTVCPPSIHQSGEQIRWENPDPEVPEVPYSDVVRGMKKVATATLISRYIWLEGQRNEVTKHIAGMLYNLGWPIDEAEKFFEALLAYNEDDDKTRLLTVRATYSKAEKGRKVTGGPTLRKLIKDGDVIVPRIYEWFGGEGQSVLQEFNERFAVVDISGKFRVAAMDTAPGKIRELYQRDDFLNLFGNAYYMGDDGKPKSKARAWLASDRRNQYTDYSFIPGVPQEKLDDDERNHGVLNLWTGWAVEPDPNASCDAWLELLRTVIAGDDPERYEWLLQWFASIVREPDVKVPTVPVLIGRPGAGKTLCLSYFGRILGEAYTPVTNPEHIHGKFNAHLGHTLLLHSEEALYGGDKKHLGIIKSLVTDETLILERKGIDPRRVPNRIRLVMSSNNERAAPVEEVDRRFCIFHLHDRKAPYELVQRVVHEMRNGGPGALLHYFLTMPDYDTRKCWYPIQSEDLQDAKALNASTILNWWKLKLETGELMPPWLMWAGRPVQPWPNECMSKALFELYKHEASDRFAKEVVFWTEMKRFLGIKNMTQAKSIRRYHRPMDIDPQVDGSIPTWVMHLPNESRTQSLIGIPHVEKARELLERHLGTEIDWPSLQEEDTPNYLEKYTKQPKF